MAKHGKPKQVNRFRGSDRAFRKGHSAYDNMLAGMESQVNETDLSNCMIKWFSVRRPVDCFPVGEEEPMPGTYTCRWRERFGRSLLAARAYAFLGGKVCYFPASEEPVPGTYACR
jgi:hypothetical protein